MRGAFLASVLVHLHGEGLEGELARAVVDDGEGLADGGVRDGLSLLDQCSGAQKIDVDAVYSAMGLAGNRRVAQLLDGILNHDTSGVLKLFNGMWMDGKDPATLLDELSGLLRDVLMMHAAPKAASGLISGGYDVATVRGFAERMTTEEILSAMTTVQERMSAMRDVKSPKTAVELCLVSLCDNTAGDSIPELKARISRLEEQIKNGITARPAQDVFPDELFKEPENGYHAGNSEPEFEELDPEMFVEERPEDMFVSRAIEREVVAEPVPKSEAAVPQCSEAVSWSDVLDRAMPALPPDIRFVIGDEKKVRAVPDGDVLRLEAEPGFIYARLNRQPVLQTLSDATSNAAGREIRVLLSEMRQTERAARSLDDLKKFDVVKFT